MLAMRCSDHSRLFTTYKNSFTGHEATQHIYTFLQQRCKNGDINEASLTVAEGLGKRLLQEEVFYRVKHDTEFSNADKLLFSFDNPSLKREREEDGGNATSQGGGVLRGLSRKSIRNTFKRARGGAVPRKEPIAAPAAQQFPIEMKENMALEKTTKLADATTEETATDLSSGSGVKIYAHAVVFVRSRNPFGV